MENDIDHYFYKRYDHIKMRLMDRYAIRLELGDFIVLNKRFQEGDYEHIKKSQHRSAGHYIEMEFKGKQIYCIVREDFIRTVVSKNQMEADSSYTHKNNVRESDKFKKNRKFEDKKLEKRRKQNVKRANKSMYKDEKPV